MSENIEHIRKLYKSDIKLSTNTYQLLVVFDNLGLLDPKALQINDSLAHCIKSVCSDDYFDTLLFLSNAVPEEFELMACIALENFSPWGNSQNDLLENQHLDVIKTRKLFSEKYEKHVNFGVFRLESDYDFKEHDTEAPVSHQLFQILYNYCGCSEEFLESFYEDKFQKYLNILGSFVLFTHEKNGKKLLEKFNKIYELEFHVKSFVNKEEFNDYIKVNFSTYIQLIQKLLIEFSLQRLLTKNVIESDLTPIENSDFYQFDKANTLSVLSFEELNILLSNIFKKAQEDLQPGIKKKLNDYINKEYSSLKPEGGFANVIVNQHNLIVKFKNDQMGSHSYRTIGDAPAQELTNYFNNLSNTLDNIAVINRLKFIISKIDLIVSKEERQELWKKVAGILSSKSTTFYSDIFELYAYSLLKSNGVPIKLLKSQEKEGKEVSTCDYKIGDDFAADCKCILSNSAEFYQISEHCEKIGKQIKSTLGFENIAFGGGIIGYRDMNFKFLSPLREYKGDENSNLSVLSFILKCYSEFRRHTNNESQEKIKFILIYYLPGSNIISTDILNSTPETLQERNELFFLLTTKYATNGEVHKIANAFKTVTPIIFQFNNSWQESSDKS